MEFFETKLVSLFLARQLSRTQTEDMGVRKPLMSKNTSGTTNEYKWIPRWFLSGDHMKTI